MNKKPTRTGPRIRITRPANRKKDEPPRQDDKSFIYTCQYCHVKFTQNNQFFRHMTTNHQAQQREATFQCDSCHKVFNKKATLDLHCQTHHLKHSKSKCEPCAITFKSRHCLRRHMKLKQMLAENTCQNCQKEFTSKDRLSNHVNNKHCTKNMAYQCKICMSRYRAEQSLLTHFNRIHKML